MPTLKAAFLLRPKWRVQLHSLRIGVLVIIWEPSPIKAKYKLAIIKKYIQATMIVYVSKLIIGIHLRQTYWSEPSSDHASRKAGSDHCKSRILTLIWRSIAKMWKRNVIRKLISLEFTLVLYSLMNFEWSPSELWMKFKVLWFFRTCLRNICVGIISCDI